MSDLINLDKLTELRDKGAISEAEFEEQKKTIFVKAMRESGEHGKAKNGIIYIILAFSLGTIGVHNFYAGYLLRGLIQLVMTLLAPMFLFLPLLITASWAMIELLIQNKAHDGRYFGGNKIVIKILRIVAVVWLGIAISSLSFDEYAEIFNMQIDENMLNAELKILQENSVLPE